MTIIGFILNILQEFTTIYCTTNTYIHVFTYNVSLNTVILIKPSYHSEVFVQKLAPDTVVLLLKTSQYSAGIIFT